jgi:multiple antibiotic resistance protein
MLNMILVYVVLKLTHFFEKLLGKTGIMILRKLFGVILLAISVKLFLSNTGITLK